MSLLRRILIVSICCSLWLFSLPAIAQESITVATWNIAFLDRNADDLDLEDFVEEVDFDILIVNEIKQNGDLNDLKTAMGKEDFFTAISSFDASNSGLEVGIISRFPLTDIVEFDRSLDNSGGVEERKLERVDVTGIANVGVGRGFLVAKIPQLKLFVVATHLKSSRGRSGDRDLNNAQKRELVAAAISDEVLQLREENPDYSVIFGGDVNVGVTDNNKNGIILDDDTTDGYDDTHAILELGLINGLKMKSLAKNVDGTFVGDGTSPVFPGTGAIDVLYVVGPLSDSFSEAQATSSSFGSDHLGVFASSGNVDIISDDDSGNISDTAPDGIEIINALPNPVGSDSGRETVTISNNNGSIVDISGWRLRDEANNIYVFPAGTMLIEGSNELTLIQNSMPLNNSGDRIVLLDINGTQIGAEFAYSSDEVEVGFPVR